MCLLAVVLSSYCCSPLYGSCVYTQAQTCHLDSCHRDRWCRDPPCWSEVNTNTHTHAVRSPLWMTVKLGWNIWCRCFRKSKNFYLFVLFVHFFASLTLLTACRAHNIPISLSCTLCFVPSTTVSMLSKQWTCFTGKHQASCFHFAFHL